jgi:hypothetical protein
VVRTVEIMWKGEGRPGRAGRHRNGSWMVHPGDGDTSTIPGVVFDFNSADEGERPGNLFLKRCLER